MKAVTASMLCADVVVPATPASDDLAVRSSDPEPLMGRIIQDGRLLRAMTEQGPLLVEPPRRARSAREACVRPLCGDWVLIEPYLGSRSDIARGRVRRVLPRRNVVARGRGADGASQAMLANVDEGWIVCGLDRDPRLRQLPRYLTILRAAQLDVLVVLNKIDLVSSVTHVESVGSAHSTEVTSVLISASTGRGLSVLSQRLAPGRVIALFGASGAGKSTLVNAFVGSSAAKTGRVRQSDARGRHTTTGSSLWETPQGALLIDTPGSRELGLGGCESGRLETFQHIESYAGNCRFSDCRHAREPGCAVRPAIERGLISAEEFLEYLELSQDSERVRERRRARRTE